MTDGLLTPVVQPLRSYVAAGLRDALGADPDALSIYKEPLGDPGLFGPTSMAWRVHSDLVAMLIGGFSALLHQTLHPLAIAGVAQHSSYRTDPLGRLRRTAHFVAATTYGASALANAEIARVVAVHERVRGQTRDGRPYSASDPALLTFVHATEVDGFLRAYQRYGPAALVAREKDQYVAEMAEIARRLGAKAVPASVTQLRAYLRAVRAELAFTAEAHDAVTFLLDKEGSARELASHLLITSAACELLPVEAQVMLGVKRPVAERVAIRSAARGFARVIRWGIGSPVLLGLASERVRAGQTRAAGSR
jgi:uncharacterized protein (DUF2236 family)